jgi:hypothetical protein
MYTFHQDDGHGWLEVPKAQLEKLDILSKITRYSYEKDENVYLEEDCDLSTFIKAIGVADSAFQAFWKESVTTKYTEPSPIRTYSRFGD